MNTPRKLVLSDLLLLILTAFAVGLLFLKGPGLGDDFTYWRTAWGVHEEGVDGWSRKFHDLRWPVWGFCWVLQGIFGPGLVSFYGVSYTYAALGSVLIFILGHRLFNSRAAAWACAIAFLFHPLLDTVIYRPMPDLSEGVFIALAVLCWLGIVESESRRTRVLFALAAGTVSAVLFANRLTGVFVFGVLGAVALVSCWRNPRFRPTQAIFWFAAIGTVWLALICVEGLIYKQITGDFLHSLHSNMGAKGRKGTESVAIWTFPFRFLGALWPNGVLGPVYMILAMLGAGVLSWCGGLRGRIVVAWAVALYLCYSCSLQSISPPRPLLRDADRFLCSLAVPLSILAIAGVGFLLSFWRKGANWAARHPVCVALVAVIFLGAATRRTWFDRGYIPEYRAYLQTVPAGTRIFTHPQARAAAYMADADKAAQLKWSVKEKILHRSDKLEQMAENSDQFWFFRKLVWLSDRKQLQNEQIEEQKTLGTFFEDPRPKWALSQVINVGGVPELTLYKKRGADSPIPRPLPLKDLFPETPAMPFRWEKGEDTIRHEVRIPNGLRGQPVSLELQGSANYVQALRVQLRFLREGALLETLELRPYLHPVTGNDFHRFQIPKEADSCLVILRFDPKAKRIDFENVVIIPEQGLAK